jgi:methylated-DNA-protein-cysteine methyltransferase-like protein
MPKNSQGRGTRDEGQGKRDRGRGTRDEGRGKRDRGRGTRDEGQETRDEGKGRNFFEDVFEVVRLIPRGRVTNYGSIAKYLGSGLSSRMVGWAMNASHAAYPPVPAQRVVNRNGMLTGKHHFATPTLMQELLEQEGVVVKNDKVVDYNNLYWDPEKELGF